MTSSISIACAMFIRSIVVRSTTSRLQALTDTWWPMQDAIGEIGFDFHEFDASYNYADRDTQRRVFVAATRSRPQISANRSFCTRARRTTRRLRFWIALCRAIIADLLCIASRRPRRRLCDCCSRASTTFSSASPAMSRSLERRTRRSVETIRDEIPLDRLLLETDAPFLCPVRGETNHSGHLDLISRIDWPN
jgi:Tat protein secretion system quality control protein TatD with DNase activity